MYIFGRNAVQEALWQTSGEGAQKIEKIHLQYGAEGAPIQAIRGLFRSKICLLAPNPVEEVAE